MKRKSLMVSVVLILLVSLALVPGSAAAPAGRTEFSGIEIPTGPPLYIEDWIELPSGNVHVRGMVSVYVEQASDPRMSGEATVVMNANWGPDMAGPMWGTSELVVSDSAGCEGGGVWHATWTGTMNSDGCYSYRAVGKGVEGCVAGLHFSFVAANPGDYQPSTYTGEILDSHGE